MGLKLTGSAIIFVVGTSLVFAHGGGGGASQQKRKAVNVMKSTPQAVADEKDMRGEVIHQERVANFELTLKVVGAKESVFDGGSHNLLVNIKRGGRTQYNLSVTGDITYVNGDVASKSMMALGDWYLAGYDLGPEEKGSIEISFQAADGTIHSSSLDYP